MKHNIKKKIPLIIILISFIIFLPYLLSSTKIIFKTSQIDVTAKGSQSYSIEFTVEHSNVKQLFFDGVPLYVSTESIHISGPLMNDSINEKNILYSQVSMDLNNNGKLDDIYKITIKSGKYFIGDYPFEIILSPNKFQSYQIFSYLNEAGKIKANTLGKEGIPFTIYSINMKGKTAHFGFGGKNSRVDILELPNPAVQIHILKAAESPSSEPQYSIEGIKNYFYYTNEKIFDAQSDEWITAVWAAAKLNISEDAPCKFHFTIKNISPPFGLIAHVNFSIEKGIRLQSERSMTIINK